MSLITRYRLFWAALMAALLGLAFWKNSERHTPANLKWAPLNLPHEFYRMRRILP